MQVQSLLLYIWRGKLKIRSDLQTILDILESNVTKENVLWVNDINFYVKNALQQLDGIEEILIKALLKTGIDK